MVALHGLVQLRDSLLHRHCGAERACRVVLVRDGRTEHRHDRIAGVLIDRPAESPDLVGECVEEGGEDPAHFLGIETFCEGCRA